MAKVTGVNIKAFGDRKLRRELALFTNKVQRKMMFRVMRKSTKRLQLAVAVNISGRVVKARTGRYLSAWLAERVKPLKKRVAVFGFGVALPTRQALGIDPQAEFYYPVVLEYGGDVVKPNPFFATPRRLPAYAPIRKAVNERTRIERAMMQAQLKKEIEKEWAKIVKKLKISGLAA